MEGLLAKKAMNGIGHLSCLIKVFLFKKRATVKCGDNI